MYYFNLFFKQVKKILIYSLVFSLIICCCTSCQANSKSSIKLDQSNPETITLWHHYKGGQNELLNEILAEFNNTVGKDKGIVVTAIGMRSAGEIYENLIQASNNEPGYPKLPNIAMVYPDAANALYEKELLVSFNQYLDNNELEMYIDSFLDEGKFTEDEKLYIFPTAKSTEVLMVNDTVYKAFINEYNDAYPDNKLSEEMLETFEGILKTAEAYYHWTDEKTSSIPYDGHALFGMDSPGNFTIVAYNQLGNDFFNIAENKTGSINFDRNVFDKIWHHYYVPMVKGYFAAHSFYRAEDTQTGDILMYTGSSAGAPFFPSTVTYRDNTKIDIQLKALPFPVFENGNKSVIQQGAGMAITKSTPQEEYASTLFLKWFTEPERNTQFILKTGYLPVTTEALEDILPQELEKVAEDPHLKNIAHVISLAVDMHKEYNFFTYRPFKNSEDIRLYFEDFILEKATEAREEFNTFLLNGGSYEEAVEKYLGQDAIEQFIAEVTYDIEKWQK